MKQKPSVFILLLLCLISACSSHKLPSNQKSKPQEKEKWSPLLEDRKHALIFAIGEYDPSTAWPSIHSNNDTAMLKTSLRKMGFEHITVISDQQATRAGIDKAFSSFIASLEPDDVALVHFSSHGQQIYDYSGDEVDGKDEAIAAYDAPSYGSNYKGDKHLLDEDLGKKLDAVRKQIGEGGDLLVLLDACYSGTGTRGNGTFRGGKPPIGPVSGSPVTSSNESVGILETDAAGRRGVGTAPMVVISAALANQKNKEYKDSVGSLSLAFTRACERANSRSTYRSLFSDICKEMSVLAGTQQPTLEGDADYLLFGGGLRDQEPFYTFTHLDGKDNYAVVDAGLLHGLKKGAILEIYPKGTAQPSPELLLSTAEVMHSNVYRATLSLHKELELTRFDYWVFLKEQQFGSMQVTVDIESLSSAWQLQVRQWLSDQPLIRINANKSDFSLREKNGKLQLLWSSDLEPYIGEIPVSDGGKVLRKHLIGHVQGHFVKELEFTDASYQIQFELIPIRVSKINGKERIESLELDSFLRNGIPTFRAGQRPDYAQVKVVNHSKYPIYFNIIGVDVRGSVYPVVPTPKESSSSKEYFLEAGDSVTVAKKMRFAGPPYGLETFKIFASEKPINLTPIFKGTTRGSLDTEIERVFGRTFALSRGEQEFVNRTESARTYSYVFRTVEN